MALVVQLVSPERVLFEGDAEMVVCRTTDGEIAFMPGHIPLVGALGIAKVRVLLADAPEVVAAVHGGFVEVSNDRVTILSDVAELVEQLDVVRARTAREAAERAVMADPEDQAAKAALARALLRLEVADPSTAHA